MEIERYQEVLAEIRSLIKGSEFEGHVYSVGGCERDFIAGREIKDIDLVVDILDGGIKLSRWLESNGQTVGSVVVYEHFGTTMFRLKNFPDIELEAVQTRKEAYRDMESRNPDTAFGSIMDDCTRRDFTYNAIYRNISTNKVCDFNGTSIEDLNNNVLKCCGEPDIIFSDDPLRIMRAVRFFSRYDSVIETKTYEGMCKNAHRLSIISRERIADELLKILNSEHVSEAIEILMSIGAMKYIFEGLDSIDGFKQKSLIEGLKLCKKECSIPTTLLAVMMHYDLKNVYNELRGLKLSNEIVNEVVFILDTVRELLKEKNILLSRNVRRLEYKCECFVTFMKVTEAYYGITFDKITYNKLIAMARRHFNNDSSLFRYKLPVDGNDIMTALNIEAGPEIKNVQNFLLEKVYRRPRLTREDCIKIIMKHYKK